MDMQGPPLEAARLPILMFSLGQKLYGLLIEDVVEVAAMVELMPLPDAPPELLGIANRHGRMLPVLDLRRVFKQTAGPVTSAHLFVVAQGGNQQIGLLVDEVHQVEYIDALQLGDSPAAGRFIHGMIGFRSQLVPIIALPPLLGAFLSAQAIGKQISEGDPDGLSRED